MKGYETQSDAIIFKQILYKQENFITSIRK